MLARAKVLIKKLEETAITPCKGSLRAAGYDLFSNHDQTVPAKGKAMVKTGISIAIPPGNYARIGSHQDCKFLSSPLRPRLEEFY
jgi:dUTPase